MAMNDDDATKHLDYFALFQHHLARFVLRVKNREISFEGTFRRHRKEFKNHLIQRIIIAHQCGLKSVHSMRKKWILVVVFCYWDCSKCRKVPLRLKTVNWLTASCAKSHGTIKKFTIHVSGVCEQVREKPFVQLSVIRSKLNYFTIIQ